MTEQHTPGIYRLTTDVDNSALKDGRKSAWYFRETIKAGQEFLVRADVELVGRLEIVPYPGHTGPALTLNPKKPRRRGFLAIEIGRHLEKRPLRTLRETLIVADRSASDVLARLLKSGELTMDQVNRVLALDTKETT